MSINSSATRRAFLQRAVVAVAAPLVLRCGPLAAAAKPSEEITLGFIGMGKQNRDLLNGFLGKDRTRVLAVCDVDTNRREQARKTVDEHYASQTTSGSASVCKSYHDFRELLERKDIDAVVIATPDHWHALISIAAANAGKDIYCEKPLAHTVVEGRAMVAATRKNNRVFQVGSMQRSMPEFLAACELVRNGVIGKVGRVNVSIGGPARFCDLPAEKEEPGLDWDFWLGPAPVRPYNSILSPRGVHDNYPDWRLYREYASGMIGDWGAHHFDIVQWAFGFDDTGPVEFLPSPEKHNPQNGVRFRYACGLEVTHGDGDGVLFEGDRGKIEVNRGHFKLWIGKDLKTDDHEKCASLVKELLPPNAVRLYHSSDHVGDFLSSVRSRKPPICDVETGHRTATICNLVSQVYYHGQTIRWDPRTESLVGGTGDPSWLTKQYRGPWKLA